MPEGGEATLAKSRLANPWWFHVVFGVALLAQLGAAAASGALVPIVMLPVLTVCWLLLLFLRVTVTSAHVHVQYGVFGPKIAVASIEEAHVEAYPLAKYGGWGMRQATDGSRAYSVPGHGGRGLLITYGGPEGKQTVFVSTDRPEELLAAIERARGGAAAGSQAGSPPGR